MEDKTRSNVFVVSLFAILAYMLTAFILTHTMVPYTTLPGSILVRVPETHYRATETSKQDTLPFVFNVHSALPMDTLEQKRTQLPLKVSLAETLFHQNPTFLVWLLLVCLMVTIAAGSVPVSFYQIKDLRNHFRFGWTEMNKAIAYASFLVLFLAVTNGNLKGYYKPPAIIDEFKILFTHGYILNGIVIATIILVSPAFVHIFLIGLVSGKLEMKDKSTAEFDKAFKKMKYLNKSLQNALQLLAIIVVFSVLTSTALGETIRRTIKIDGFNIYPHEVSYVYGLYFSLFLCIIYVPVYFYIKQNFLKLKDEAFDLVISDPAKYTTWYSNHFSQSKFETTVVDNLKLALTMLSPLLSGFLPETFGLIK